MTSEEKAFEEFNKWRKSLDYDLGDAVEDWEEWWKCFLAGYKISQKNIEKTIERFLTVMEKIAER